MKGKSDLIYDVACSHLFSLIGLEPLVPLEKSATANQYKVNLTKQLYPKDGCGLFQCSYSTITWAH